MDDATIDTREAGYAQVKARDLTTDHVVIDVHGGEHKVTRVRRYYSQTRACVRFVSSVRVERADGWIDHFDGDQTVTVRR